MSTFTTKHGPAAPAQRVLRAALAALALAASAAAHADRFGVQLGGGIGDRHIKKGDLALVWDPDMTWWDTGSWHFALVGEMHVSYWHTDEGDGHSNIGEFGMTPVVRFIKNSGQVRPYVEAGVGVRWLTHPRISARFTVSSAFQFADMVGVGAQFGERQQYQAGFRFQHVSNGGIKQPNPGINFTQLYLQYNF
ncbi:MULTISPECIES: acyloxyacyl hydrolase [Burkholderiaceae]|uniref:acyloxyacyl hydrolase n=1 Tax=Burkholderiaceae TaxID=119060 RepID=UPI00095D3E32|nr:MULTISPECIES: acyloxyacyl hydrolase [Burkholderiaceae]MCF2134964.1 acyloxyacyl hydrolase [Mycetohabitans sp. B3]MCG1040282.1 acyloxyacyl hydrolase [Mycetohabitans sp. B7]SIT73576.1 Lipid A 3-O-deacylase (PagL) [Burkholderia sp. b14]